MLTGKDHGCNKVRFDPWSKASQDTCRSPDGFIPERSRKTRAKAEAKPVIARPPDETFTAAVRARECAVLPAIQTVLRERRASAAKWTAREALASPSESALTYLGRHGPHSRPVAPIRTGFAFVLLIPHHRGRRIFDQRSRTEFGGPFNGQLNRKSLFDDIVAKLDITAIVETGAYRASTTEYMAKVTGLPVFSCEVDPRMFAYSRRRLEHLPNANAVLARQDSVVFPRSIIADPRLRQRREFSYLDAHWHENLALKEEIRTILRSDIAPAIMIDDFAVPGGPAIRVRRLRLRQSLEYRISAPVR
jgi:hypothetical protein